MNQNQKDINKIRKDTSTVLYIVILILIIISVTLGVSYFKENKKTKNLNQTIDKLQEEKDDLVSKNKELKKEQKEDEEVG